MSVDARIRKGLAMIEATLPEVDPHERYDDLGARVRKSQQRRTAVTVIAAAAAVAAAAVIVDAQLGKDRAAPPPATPSSEWVLVSSVRVGTDYAAPVGDEWSAGLGEPGARKYPYWMSVDPATRRFLINADEGTALEVMTPGRPEPLLRFECTDDLTGCLGAALGPGPDELTMQTGDMRLVVAGPDGGIERDLGLSGQGLMHGLAWTPDGTSLATAHSEHSADQGSLTVALRTPDSAESTTLYEYSEGAPPWYDAEEHRFGDGPGAFNNWHAPSLTDLQWSPDSTRLAFTVAATPEGGDDDERQLTWQLFLADPGTGDVEMIADLGRCTEPVDETGRHAGECDRHGYEPSLSWTPDGRSITVLADSKLTTYDRAGKELSSQPSDLIGPIAWLTWDAPQSEPTPPASSEPKSTPADEWSGPLREVSSMPVRSGVKVEGDVGATGWVDARDAAVGAVDIRNFHVGTTDEGQPSWSLELRKLPPRTSTLDPGRVIEYGVVVDADGDRTADCQVGLNTNAPSRGDYRVWVKNLTTGVDDERVGPPYGVPVEFAHPDETRTNLVPQSWMHFHFLSVVSPGYSPGEPCDPFQQSAGAYAYASVTEQGQVTAWDYAPDAAWLEAQPS